MFIIVPVIDTQLVHITHRQLSVKCAPKKLFPLFSNFERVKFVWNACIPFASAEIRKVLDRFLWHIHSLSSTHHKICGKCTQCCAAFWYYSTCIHSTCVPIIVVIIIINIIHQMHRMLWWNNLPPTLDIECAKNHTQKIWSAKERERTKIDCSSSSWTHLNANTAHFLHKHNTARINTQSNIKCNTLSSNTNNHVMHVAEKRNFADTAMFIKAIMCNLSIERGSRANMHFYTNFSGERDKKDYNRRSMKYGWSIQRNGDDNDGGGGGNGNIGIHVAHTPRID